MSVRVHVSKLVGAKYIYPKTFYSPPIDSMLASSPSGTVDELYMSISSSQKRSPPNRSDEAETAVESMAGHSFAVMIVDVLVYN